MQGQLLLAQWQIGWIPNDVPESGRITPERQRRTALFGNRKERFSASRCTLILFPPSPARASGRDLPMLPLTPAFPRHERSHRIPRIGRALAAILPDLLATQFLKTA
jgi:hypothetical protein